VGEVTRAEAFAVLREDNKGASVAELTMYAEAFCQWTDATENIRKQGTICASPRTGQPMDNPYLKVQTRAAAEMRAIEDLKTDRLWKTTETTTEEEPCNPAI
jgi:phage terminase small subunit